MHPKCIDARTGHESRPTRTRAPKRDALARYEQKRPRLGAGESADTHRETAVPRSPVQLERLLRYGSRPPFAQKRRSLTPSGRVRLKLRKPYYAGQTELVLEPEAFVRRLFAIIPPPRWHLTRYHGIFSGHHRMRSKLAALVPEPPGPAASPPRTGREGGAETDDEPLPNAGSRLCYAKLLSRTLEQDIGRCEHCGGALRLLACIDDPDAIATILNHLGLDTQAPRAAPARSPPQLALDWD